MTIFPKFLVLFIFLFAIQVSKQDGFPYDYMHWVVFGQHDRERLHQAGWDSSGQRSYIARLITEDGEHRVGHYVPENVGNNIYFAWQGGMRYVEDHKFYKVQLLQHTRIGGGGLTWHYAYKTFQDDPGRKHNLTMSVGRTKNGQRVFICRGMPIDGKLDLHHGMYIEGQQGCAVHHTSNTHVLDHFEVAGISFLGLNAQYKRFYGNPNNDFCLRNHNGICYTV